MCFTWSHGYYQATRLPGHRDVRRAHSRAAVLDDVPCVYEGVAHGHAHTAVQARSTHSTLGRCNGGPPRLQATVRTRNRLEYGCRLRASRVRQQTVSTHSIAVSPRVSYSGTHTSDMRFMPCARADA